jgi:periplasmic divalent cation tolerance protein
MSEIVLVYTLFGDRDAAEAVARAMVERRLAACANLLGDGTSIYPWEGRIDRAGEVPVLFKTVPARRDALMAAIGAMHNYDLPAILSWSAVTTPAYAAWVAGETDS